MNPRLTRSAPLFTTLLLGTSLLVGCSAEGAGGDEGLGGAGAESNGGAAANGGGAGISTPPLSDGGTSNDAGASGTAGAPVSMGGSGGGTGGTDDAGSGGTGDVQAGSGGAPVAGEGGDGGGPDDGEEAGTGGQDNSGNAGSPVIDDGPGLGGDGFYRVEALDRGLVAIPTGGGVYVGWRMFGYEHDPNAEDAVSYNLYRDGDLIANVTDSTNYLDADGVANSMYAVAAVRDDVRGDVSPEAAVWAENFIRIPLESPGPNHPNDASAADLDGDGEYDLVVKWEADNSKDNSQSGATSDVFLDGIKLDGTRLWRINLGPNIRAGAHYTQFIVMDLDGDGRAEMGVKTAPGTRDSTGEYLKLGPAADDDDSAVYRNGDGYVLSGPEYFTIFDGASGVELATADFAIPRGRVADWGDDYGNRVDRFLGAGAWLDDSGLPSVIMARGYYTRTTLTAWNFRDGQLSELWTFDSNEVQGPYTGQGNHSLSVANVDDDPGQEIIYGAMVVDHDGTARCSTNLLHGDALHAGDLVPDHPGIEVFGPTENSNKPKWFVYDASSCEIISQGPVSDDDVGRGVAADVSADSPGAELWASSGVSLTSATSGQSLGGNGASINFLAWWNADELRELEDGNTVTTFGGQVLLQCAQCSSNNGTKSTPALVADILGDWREEVIWRETNNAALRVYTTTDVTARRIHTLMHDPQYRSAISWQNVAYNQPPHPGFFIGAGMSSPPKPDIRTE